MLSKAGIETGEKDLQVTEDKNGRISRRVEWSGSLLQRILPGGLRKHPMDRAAEKSLMASASIHHVKRGVEVKQSGLTGNELGLGEAGKEYILFQIHIRCCFDY